MKRISLILMSLLYISAGIYHFINPTFYLKIMPDYIPSHLMMIYLSGAIEIILGIALLIKKFQKPAAMLIILMLIVFIPVHIKMIQDTWISLNIKFITAIVRLPLQFVLIYWAYKTCNLRFPKLLKG
ncbi:MAG: DoxX family membrane protein [Bacteroidota bacterium]|nr:DoxX family membrane protein [Bacteroidota bacterium]